MAEKKHILFINQELSPYVNTGENADKLRELVTSLHDKTCEVRTFMPKFGNVNERRNQLHEVIRLSGANISIADSDHPLILKVASLPPARIQVYFIDNDDYFQKEASDSDVFGSNREDNDERTIFYARSVVDTVSKLKWEAETIHISGWFGALVPVYMRQMAQGNPMFASTKIVYTPGNCKLESPLSKDFLSKLKDDELPESSLGAFSAEGLTDTNLLHRLAIDNADAVVFFNEPDAEIEAYARERGIPVLTRGDLGEDAEIPTRLKEFYSSLQNK